MPWSPPQTLATTDPAANVEISHTFETRVHSLILSCVVTLVTDANAANRTVQLQHQNAAGTVIWANSARRLQTAGETIVYHFQPHTTNETATVEPGSRLITHMPFSYMRAGWIIATSTNNRQAGDNFGAMTITRRVWINDIA